MVRPERVVQPPKQQYGPHNYLKQSTGSKSSFLNQTPPPQNGFDPHPSKLCRQTRNSAAMKKPSHKQKNLNY
jgi:hypothetical protein